MKFLEVILYQQPNISTEPCLCSCKGSRFWNTKVSLDVGGAKIFVCRIKDQVLITTELIFQPPRISHSKKCLKLINLSFFSFLPKLCLWTNVSETYPHCHENKRQTPNEFLRPLMSLGDHLLCIFYPYLAKSPLDSQLPFFWKSNFNQLLRI